MRASCSGPLPSPATFIKENKIMYATYFVARHPVHDLVNYLRTNPGCSPRYARREQPNAAQAAASTTDAATTEESTAKAKEAPERLVRPEVRVEDREADYLLVADLPGVKRDDIDIRVEDGELRLRATRNAPADTGVKTCYQRRLRLPDHVQTDAISAAYEDGVLSLTVPKTPQAKPVRVEVH